MYYVGRQKKGAKQLIKKRQGSAKLKRPVVLADFVVLCFREDRPAFSRRYAGTRGKEAEARVHNRRHSNQAIRQFHFM